MAAVAAAAAAAAAAAVDARAAVAAVGARVQLLPAGDASPGLLGPPLLVLSRRCACVADDIDAAAQPRNSPIYICQQRGHRLRHPQLGLLQPNNSAAGHRPHLRHSAVPDTHPHAHVKARPWTHGG